MKQIATATEAEQLAKQAATEAGWKTGIVWPRVQMMSSQLEDTKGPLGRLMSEVTQVFDDAKQRQVYANQTEEEEAVVVTPMVDTEQGLVRRYPLLILVLVMCLVSATDYLLTTQRLPQFPHLFQYVLIELLSLKMVIQTFVNLGLWMGMLTSLYIFSTHHLLTSASLSSNLVLSLTYVALSLTFGRGKKGKWWATVGIGLCFWMLQKKLQLPDDQFVWISAHALNGSLVIILREVMYCLHNIKIWYQTVIRERRRLGPQQMSHPSHQQLALQASLQPTDTTTTHVQMAGDLYSNRICFLCLGGYCQRCLLSIGQQSRQEPTDVASEKKGRWRSLEMWVASSVAHCPCRNIHGPGPSSFVHNSHNRPTGVVPPPGTLVSLGQYARELKTRGLVKQLANRNRVSVSGDDAVGEVLPLIFGRFTVPNDGQAPFLAKDQKVLKPTTPLSHAIVSRQSFRLTVQRIDGQHGTIQLGIGVTPPLVYRLLSATNASVCVPASLITHKGTAAMDVDPKVDYVRVMVPKPELVVRVNGERWHQIEFNHGLSGPLCIRGLTEGYYLVGVEICGIKSQDLHLLVKSKEYEIPLAEQLEQLARQRTSLQQRMKKLRKETGKQAVDMRQQTEVEKRGWDRQKINVERLQKKKASLEMSVNRVVVPPQKELLPKEAPIMKVEDGKERLRMAERELREVRDKIGQLETEKEEWKQAVRGNRDRLDELKKKLNKMKSC